MKYQFSQNQKILLDLIRRLGPVPRVKLSELSGLTAGAVTRHCKELLLLGLIQQGQTVSGQRGQPAQPLSLAPVSNFSIGAAFYPNQIDLAVIDFAGKVLVEDSFKFSEQNPFDTAKQLSLLSQSMLTGAKLDIKNCLGFGLAIPGFTQDQGKNIRTVKALNSWRNTDLQAAFETHLAQPCYLENIASAGALTELYSDTHTEQQHSIFLHIGYGIGAGIITDGRLYKGKLGNAGEIGGFYPLDKPRPSGLDLLHHIHTAGIHGVSIADIDDSDPTIMQVVENWSDRASLQLAKIVHSAQCWFAPEKIVLGGPLPTSIMQIMVKKIKQEMMTYQSNLPSISVSASPRGMRATSIGAALMPMHALCSPYQ